MLTCNLGHTPDGIGMKIDATECARLLDENPDALVVDVRTPAEFREMHIPGAHSMPLDRLDPEQLKSLAAADSACVVVCYSGKRSDQACQRLHQAGLGQAVSLEGGLERWERMELPLERSAKGGIAIIRQVQIVAGSMVFLGVILTVTVSPWWAILPGFFGAGLTFAGITGFCGLGLVLAKMPWNKV